ACALISPVNAGERYMTGSPELTAAVSGTNEFSPGDDAVIAVQLQNEGLNELKFVGSGIITRDDQPNTAKLITITLAPGESPLIIKSDPQMIGDLKGGSSTIVKFTVKIPKNATVGTYELPLNLKYTYLWMAEQMGTDSIQYMYRDVNQTLSLPVKIKPVLQFSLVSVDTEHLNAGTEGYLTLVINNTGQEDGKKAIVKIARNDNSMVIPTDSSSYIGDFPVGAKVTSTFKVSVSNEAENKSYPLDVYVNYENYEGDIVDSERTTIGIPVGGKTEFLVVSDPIGIPAGQKKTITVRYQNAGNAPVYSAQARISAVDPFTSDDDTAFLGTFAPGEGKEATFEISADGGATPKEYGLDSEVRYRDALDNSIISDPIKVRIEVVERSNTLLYLLIGIIALGIIAGGYYYYQRHQKGNGEGKSG
ncbi:MAG TPA: S-layer protein, partial [Methanoregulaceae archaeon]|nr:S-layer protein [Methanoregulaceae archaeon]